MITVLPILQYVSYYWISKLSSKYTAVYDIRCKLLIYLILPITRLSFI